MAPDSSAFERIKPYIRMLEGSIDRARSERLERERVNREKRVVSLPAHHRLNGQQNTPQATEAPTVPSEATSQLHMVPLHENDQGWLIGG